MSPSTSPMSRGIDSHEGERGTALLEFALIIPILIVVLAIMFDVGVGFGAGQSSAEAARSAARSATQDPVNRQADYQALNSIRLSFDDANDTVQWVAIYRTTPAAGAAIPAACQPGGGGAAGVCNVYTGAQIENLTVDQFDGEDCTGSPDALWCPLDRGENEGDYLGVAIWGGHQRAVGLIEHDPIPLQNQAVFPIFVGGATNESSP